MSDKELIQALRCCASDDECGCLGCPGEKNCDAIAGGGKSLLDAADRLEALLAENEHLREVTKMAGKDINVPTKWVSVRDRSPMEGEMVLAFSPQDGTNIAKYVGFGGFLVQCADIWRHPARVTHWMELPGTAEVRL